MRKEYLVGAIILAVTTLVLYAQQVTPKVSAKELEIVYEKTFDESVMDVIFDTVTVSIKDAIEMGWKEKAFTLEDKAQGKVLVSYPRVVFVSRERESSCYSLEARRGSYYVKALEFYREDGRLLRKLDIEFEEGYERVYLSPQKKYIVISRIPTEYNHTFSGGTLYDCDGREIWEIDGPTPIAVSDEGYAIGVHLDWQVPPQVGGDFYVYNSNGDLISTVENLDKEKTSPLFAEFSKDASYAMLGFTGSTTPPTTFLLTTQGGEILWTIDLQQYMYSRSVGEIDMLPNEGIAGCIYKGGLHGFFLDWTGKLMWVKRLTSSGYGGCKFSQERGNVYICSSRGYLWSFDAATGEKIWMHRQPWSPPLDNRRPLSNVPRFAEIYEQSENVIIKGHPSKIYVFDGRTGKLTTQVEYPNKRIFLSLNNGVIFVINTTDKKVFGLRIKEE